MKSFQWNHTQIRVWLNEGDLWTFQPETMSEAKYQVPNQQQVGGQVAVEVLKFLGERYMYGALCAKYTTGPVTDQLFVQVPLSDQEGPLLEDSLAAKIDLVRIGLPREYRAGVQSGIEEASQIVGAGTLNIVGAAHGQLHSSLDAFHKTGLLLMHVLHDPHQLDHQDSVNMLLQQIFRQKPK